VVSHRHVNLKGTGGSPAVHCDVRALLRGVVDGAEDVTALGVALVASLADEFSKIVAQCIVHAKTGVIFLLQK